MIHNSLRHNSYRCLYRFLKENGIFCNYIANLRKKHPCIHSPKELLYIVVDTYDSRQIFDNNLFNDGEASFYWKSSIEGILFWTEQLHKWDDFFKKYKEKYQLRFY